MISLRSRFGYVDLACRVATENHIIKATCHAADSYLLQQGIDTVHFPEEELADIELVYTPFIYAAVSSIYTVGYFAFVMDRINGKLRPRILPPHAYILVTASNFDHSDMRPKTYYTVILRNQDECDRYRANPPTPYVLHPPEDTGKLASPTLNLIDMHDTVLELVRLSLLHEAIRTRPKAWLTHRDKKDDACYSFLNESTKHCGTSSQHPPGNPDRSVHEDMLQRNRNLAQERHFDSPATFSRSLMNRSITMDAVKDPGVLVHAPPDFNVVQMSDTPPRHDLEHIIRLFDQRMCNSLGVPPAVIGLLQSAQATTSVPESLRAWQSSLSPFRNLINHALADALDHSHTKIAAIKYKKTRDRKWLNPVRLSLSPAISLETALTLQPYLKPKEFAEIISKITGIKSTDFSQAPMCWVMDQNSTAPPKAEPTTTPITP